MCLKKFTQKSGSMINFNFHLIVYRQCHNIFLTFSYNVYIDKVQYGADQLKYILSYILHCVSDEK